MGSKNTWKKHRWVCESLLSVLMKQEKRKKNNTKENYCPKLPFLGNKAVRVSVTSDILRWLFKRYSFVGNDRVDLYLNPK